MSDARVRFFTANKWPAPAGAEVYFSFSCPNGNECCWWLILGKTDIQHDPQNLNGGRAQWQWDGHRASPTFAPSLNCGGCWHGYIEKGRCVNTTKIDEPEPPPR